jgi:hypothetical protein
VKMFGGLWRIAGRHGGASSPPDPRVSGFIRGLTVGAFVGAVIAGSAIWNRRTRNR